VIRKRAYFEFDPLCISFTYYLYGGYWKFENRSA
jgi:hypothetical protein